MGHTRGVLTAPKLVCLPVGPGKLHRNSFVCQKGAGTDLRRDARRPAMRALAPSDQHRRSSRRRGRQRSSAVGPASALSASAAAMEERHTARLFIIFPGNAPRTAEALPRRPRTTRPHLVEAPLGREAVLERDGPSPLFVPQDHAPCGQCPPVSLDVGPIPVGTIAGLHVFTWQPH